MLPLLAFALTIATPLLSAFAQDRPKPGEDPTRPKLYTTIVLPAEWSVGTRWTFDVKTVEELLAYDPAQRIDPVEAQQRGLNELDGPWTVEQSRETTSTFEVELLRRTGDGLVLRFNTTLNLRAYASFAGADPPAPFPLEVELRTEGQRLRLLNGDEVHKQVAERLARIEAHIRGREMEEDRRAHVLQRLRRASKELATDDELLQIPRSLLRLCGRSFVYYIKAPASEPMRLAGLDVPCECAAWTWMNDHVLATRESRIEWRCEIRANPCLQPWMDRLAEWTYTDPGSMKKAFEKASIGRREHEVHVVAADGWPAHVEVETTLGIEKTAVRQRTTFELRRPAAEATRPK